MFHGGGHDAATIARRWGLQPGSPIPANIAEYVLVFPTADPRLSGEWVHWHRVAAHQFRPGRPVPRLRRRWQGARPREGAALPPCARRVGDQPAPVPVVYVHGTGEHTFRPPATLAEVPIDTTQLAFTVHDMLTRNGILPTAPAASTTLVASHFDATAAILDFWHTHAALP